MIRNLLFDFDGVILDSMPIRERGFWELFPDHPREQVAKLVAYHLANGGLSRYAKIGYYFREVLGREISEPEVREHAGRFSNLVKNRLCDKTLFIHTTVRFIAENHDRFAMHVVSGSDQDELREVCARLDLAQYFRSLHGSPTPKTELVAQLLRTNGYAPMETALIGDSGNDRDAARKNGIRFVGFNNDSFAAGPDPYVRDFQADWRRAEEQLAAC